MKRLVLITVLTATAAGALLPSAAAAEPDFPTILSFHFSQRASHGYKLAFSATEGQREQADLTFYKRGESLSYTVRGKSIVKGNRIRADFGPFGSVRGRYTGKVRDKDDDCDPLIRRDSTFRGRLVARAEHDLSKAKAHRAKGELTGIGIDPDCDAAPGRTKPPSHRQRAVLSTCPTGRGVRYLAYFDRRHDVVSHQALGYERRGRVRIARLAYANGPGKTFTVDKNLTEAKVKPGGAFSGSGTYADGELTGDLAVALPGLGDPVTIAPTNATLRAGNRPGRCTGLARPG